MTPTCWPNQMWKIVTFLTMFLGTDLSQEKQKNLKSEISYSCQRLTQTIAAAWTKYRGLGKHLFHFRHKSLRVWNDFLLTGQLFFQSRLDTDNVDFICPVIFFLLVKYNLLCVTYYKGYVCTYRKLKRNTERYKVRNPRIA